MTAQQVIEDIFRTSGKPSNLQIYTTPGDETTFDITLPGSVKILRYVNLALSRIANWQFRDGRVLRFRHLYARRLFNVLTPHTGMANSGSLSSVVIPGFATNVAGQFDGWILEITAGTGAGDIRLVTSSLPGTGDITLTVNNDFSVALDNTSEYSLYKAFMTFRPDTTVSPYMAYDIQMDPTRELSDIIKVRDVSNYTDLSTVESGAVFTNSLTQSGIPTQYRVYGNQLWFDVPVKEARAYEILYVRHPIALVAATDELDMPVLYHEAVLLWALHTVQRAYQDLDGAYASKRELEDLMAQLRLQGSFGNELEATGLTIWG